MTGSTEQVPAASSPTEVVVGSPTTTSRSWYQITLVGLSFVFALVAFLFVGNLIYRAWPVLGHQPLTLVTSANWGGEVGQYGALSQIVGTLQSSFGAVILAVVVGLAATLALVFLVPRRLRVITSTLIELLAAVPSVVYGAWGFITLGPWALKHIEPFLGRLPFANQIFGPPSQYASQSLLMAIIVLAVMVLPTFVAVAREVIAAVPQDLLEASQSLGATWWQTMWRVVLPSAKVGLFGAASLALARAAGETVAVLFIIGGSSTLQWHLLMPGTTLASWIAAQFGESSGVGINALMALGVLLMIINFSLALVSQRMVGNQRRRLAVV